MRILLAIAALCAASIIAASAYAQTFCDDRTCYYDTQFLPVPEKPVESTRHHVRHKHIARKEPVSRPVHSRNVEQYPWIDEARRYVNSNPTDWSHEWCARFANRVLASVGIRGSGSNRADSFADWGIRAAPRTPGAIAVWDHHVAFVVRCSAHHCRVISGNDYGHLVREVDRNIDDVIAWRMPRAPAKEQIPIPRPRPAPVVADVGGEGAVEVPPSSPPAPSTLPELDGIPVVSDVKQVVEDFIGSARRYLIRTASPGYTMERQGDRAVNLLQPKFAQNLAETLRAARKEGIDAGVFSAYRPPSYGIGGFKDKFNSLHAAGLAVDLEGIGRPGSRTAIRFHEIALQHHVYCIYGPYNRAEWNHCQGTRLAVNPPALRALITAKGPKDERKMWLVAERYMTDGPMRIAHSRHHYHYHERHHIREAG